MQGDCSMFSAEESEGCSVNALSLTQEKARDAL